MPVLRMTKIPHEPETPCMYAEAARETPDEARRRPYQCNYVARGLIPTTHERNALIAGGAVLARSATVAAPE